MNFAVSDGQGLIVTRFRSSRNQDPPSLYYKIGLSDKYRPDPSDTSSSSSSSSSSSNAAADPTNGGFGGGIRANALTVASEPLEMTEPALSAWRLLGMRVECVSDQCTPDTPADFGAVQEHF